MRMTTQVYDEMSGDLLSCYIPTKIYLNFVSVMGTPNNILFVILYIPCNNVVILGCISQSEVVNDNIIISLLSQNE